MKKLLATLCGVLILFGLSGAASANLISNGDFETGDLTDWNYSGSVSVYDASQTSLAGALASAQGMDGNFALIGAGTISGTSSLNQSFTVSGVSQITLSFDYVFDTLDLSWSDDTFLALTTFDGSVIEDITMLDIQSSLIGVNYGTYTTTITLDPTLVVTGDMSFILTEAADGWWGLTASLAGIDNVSVTAGAPVPEPATMLLLGTGLLGLGGFGRKRFFKNRF